MVHGKASDNLLWRGVAIEEVRERAQLTGISPMCGSLSYSIAYSLTSQQMSTEHLFQACSWVRGTGSPPSVTLQAKSAATGQQCQPAGRTGSCGTKGHSGPSRMMGCVPSWGVYPAGRVHVCTDGVTSPGPCVL